jgi:hypothetical protein
MTLVTSDHIAPLYPTCKSLHTEITPFLEAKIARMKLRRATPRVILYPRALRAFFDQVGTLHIQTHSLHP